MRWSISGQALQDHAERAVVGWLVTHGLEDPRPVVAASSPVPLILSAVNNYHEQMLGGLAWQVAAISSSLQHPDAKVIGLDRGGGGWWRGATFCITSAFIRLLGALEQIEVDVLKALLYYRPHGQPLGHESDQIDTTVDLEIVTEEPGVRNPLECPHASLVIGRQT